MTRLSDQLSAASQAQFEAQLDLFRTCTERALDSAGQLAALNLRVSRELFAFGTAAHGQWQALLSCGRALFGLGAGLRALPLPAAPTINFPTSYRQALEQASIATADAAAIGGDIAAAAVDIGAAHAEAAIDAGSVARMSAAPAAAAAPAATSESSIDATIEAAVEAAVDRGIAEQAPPVEPTPLAKALHEVVPPAAGAAQPLASSVPLEAAAGEFKLPPLTPPKPARAPRRK